jgi:hypothetical protein
MRPTIGVRVWLKFRKRKKIWDGGKTVRKIRVKVTRIFAPQGLTFEFVPVVQNKK